MSVSDELRIPDAAIRDGNSFEVLRVWVAEEGQHVSLRTGTWKDPAAWGIMLCDLMHHIADAYRESEGLDQTATLNRIKEGLNAELSAPTDRPTGRIVH